MFNFWKRRYDSISYTDLLRILQSGYLDECRRLLAFHESIEYLNGVDTMLLKYRRPGGDTRMLTLHSTTQKGEFELAILNIPWNRGDFPFIPLILQRGTGLIYGIMLPFNELHEVLSSKQHKQIGELSMIWTKFAIEQQMSIQPGT